jgi:hypothetical protein
MNTDAHRMHGTEAPAAGALCGRGNSGRATQTNRAEIAGAAPAVEAGRAAGRAGNGRNHGFWPLLLGFFGLSQSWHTHC